MKCRQVRVGPTLNGVVGHGGTCGLGLCPALHAKLYHVGLAQTGTFVKLSNLDD